MDVQAEVERIRAVLKEIDDAEYTSEIYSAVVQLVPLIPPLLRIIERQQRVIEAAEALRDADVYAARVRNMVAMNEYEALIDALAGLGGGDAHPSPE